MNKKETNAKIETVIAASPYYSYCQRCRPVNRYMKQFPTLNIFKFTVLTDSEIFEF